MNRGDRKNWGGAKVVILVGFFGVILWFVIGDGNTGDLPSLTLTDQNTASQEEIVSRAFEEVSRTCAGINKYAATFEKISATIWSTPAAPYRMAQFGWGPEIEFVLLVKEDAKNGILRSNGHNLFIFAGAGSRPGIVVGATFTRRLCDQPETSNDDLFIPVPALSFLAGLRPPPSRFPAGETGSGWSSPNE